MLKSSTNSACLLVAGLAVLAPGSVRAAEVVLRWEAIAGAVSYDVQLARNARFTKLLADESVPTPGYRWSGSTDTDLFWRVRSVDSEGRPSVWSPTRVIRTRLPTPELESPAAGARLIYAEDPLEVTFEVSPSSGATEYVVEIATSETFKSPARVKSPSNRIVARLPAIGRLFWRARAHGPKGRMSAASEARELYVALGRPAAVSGPAAPIVFDPKSPRLEVRWRDLALVKLWRVELAHGPEIVSRADARKPRATLTIPEPGFYAVRVAGVDNAGKTGEWSRWTDIVIDAPPIVEPETEPEPVVEPDPKVEVIAADAVAVTGAAEPVRAQVEPALLELVADGSDSAEMAVSFYDRDGQVIQGQALRATCAAGEVRVVGERDGRYRVRYRAPSTKPTSGSTSISLELGSFETRTRVELSTPIYRWQVAAHVGWLTNAGAISSPYAAIAVGWRLPVLGDSLVVAGSLGYYAASREVEEIPVSGDFVPLTLSILADLVVDPVRLYAGLGGGVVIGAVGPSYDVGITTHALGRLTAGAAYPIGPGEIDLALAGELSLANQTVVKGRLSGFVATLGYRYTLPW